MKNLFANWKILISLYAPNYLLYFTYPDSLYRGFFLDFFLATGPSFYFRYHSSRISTACKPIQYKKNRLTLLKAAC